MPNPVNMVGGAMGPESQKSLAAASLLGLEEAYSLALFRQIHVDNRIPESHKDFVALAESLGIAAARFEQECLSFPVQGMVSTYDRQTEQAKIEAVPEILVNGKYLITMESVETEEEFFDLVEYVLHLDDDYYAAASR